MGEHLGFTLGEIKQFDIDWSASSDAKALAEQIDKIKREYEERQRKRIKERVGFEVRVNTWATDLIERMRAANAAKLAEKVANAQAQTMKEVIVKMQYAGAAEKGTVAGYSASLPRYMKTMQGDMAETADNTGETNEHLLNIESLLEDQTDAMPEPVGF